jgi:hypothetical protein
MVTRVRTKQSLGPLGSSQLRSGNTYNPPGYFQDIVSDDYISDTVQVGDNGPLLIEHVRRKEPSEGFINGSSALAPSFIGRICINHVPTAHRSMADRADHIDITVPSNASLALRLMNMTNPSRATVSVPTFVGELRDLPQLVRVAGGNALRKAAGANVNAQFGWAPMLDDLKKMLDFGDQFAKREKELKALFQSGLKRTRNLYSSSQTARNNDAFIDSTAYISCHVIRTKMTKVRIWGACHWKPNSLPPATDDAMRALARKAVSGLNSDPANVLMTAWELLPWSWLIDYFTQIGTYLAASSNVVNATCSHMSIMKQSETEEKDIPLSIKDGLVMTPATFTRVTKVRTPVSVPTSPNAQLPILSDGQLSILGSLAILRFKRT